MQFVANFHWNKAVFACNGERIRSRKSAQLLSSHSFTFRRYLTDEAGSLLKVSAAMIVIFADSNSGISSSLVFKQKKERSLTEDLFLYE